MWWGASLSQLSIYFLKGHEGGGLAIRPIAGLMQSFNRRNAIFRTGRDDEATAGQGFAAHLHLLVSRDPGPPRWKAMPACWSPSTCLLSFQSRTM